VTACALEAGALGVDLRKGGNDGRERDKACACTMDHAWTGMGGRGRDAGAMLADDVWQWRVVSGLFPSLPRGSSSSSDSMSQSKTLSLWTTWRTRAEGRRKGRTARPGPTVEKRERRLMNWTTVRVGASSSQGRLCIGKGGKIKKGGRGRGKRWGTREREG